MTGRAGRSVPHGRPTRYDRQSRELPERDFRLALLFPYRRERPAAGGPDNADGSVGGASEKPPAGDAIFRLLHRYMLPIGKVFLSLSCEKVGIRRRTRALMPAATPDSRRSEKRFATARGICAKLRHFIILNSSAYGSSQSLFAPAKSVPQRSARPDARRSSAVRVAARPASINSSAR